MGNVDFWSEDSNSKIPVDENIIIYLNLAQTEVLVEAKFDFDEVIVYTVSGDLYKYENPCSCPRMMLDVSDFSSSLYVIRISNSEQHAIYRLAKI